MTQKTNTNPWQMDVRVRERNLKSGALTDKDLEKHLAGLTDLADHVEPFGTPQPALAQPPAAPVAHAIAEESDLDDEDEEDQIPAGADGAGPTGEP
jgi:hypothetical protein